MLPWLIRVNETIQKETFGSMGKVKVQKFSGRSERGPVLEQTGETMPVGFFMCLVSGRVSKANKTFSSLI